MRPFLCLVFFATSAALAQGPLAPSAGPAPLGKTLAQIEPRTDILTLAGNGTSAYVISQPGSYYLSGPVPYQSKNAILVQADNVSVDLNGFTLTGAPGTANGFSGIFASGTRKNVSVRNGSTVGWGNAGVQLASVTTGEVRGVVTTDSPGTGSAGTGVGVIVGTGFLLVDCQARTHTGRGFIVGDGCLVRNCLASGNGGMGFESGADCHFADCSARSNGSAGFYLGERPQVRGCTATGSTTGSFTGAGFRALNGALFFGCFSAANAGQGYTVGLACTFSYCGADSNGTFNFQAGAGGAFLGCNSTRAGSNGFFLGEGTQVVQCNAYLANANGVVLAQGSVVRDSNVASCKSSGIIALGPNSLITGNNSALNGTTGSTFAGIASSAAEVRLEGNHATGNIGYGVSVSGPSATGNVLLRNSSRANTLSSYSLVVGNDVGPIGQAATSTSPFANLQ